MTKREIERHAANLERLNQRFMLVATQGTRPGHMRDEIGAVQGQAGRIMVALVESQTIPELNAFRGLVSNIKDRHSDDAGSFAWEFMFTAWCRKARPLDFAKGDFELYPAFKTDDAGNVLGRDGKPLKREIIPNPDYPEHTGFRTIGEPARISDDWGEEEWSVYHRAKAHHYAAACRVLAETLKDFIANMEPPTPPEIGNSNRPDANEWLSSIATQIDELFCDPVILQKARDLLWKYWETDPPEDQSQAIDPWHIVASGARGLRPLEIDEVIAVLFTVRDAKWVGPTRLIPDPTERIENMLKEKAGNKPVSAENMERGRNVRRILWQQSWEARMKLAERFPLHARETIQSLLREAADHLGRAEARQSGKPRKKKRKTSNRQRRTEPNANDMRIYKAYLDTGTYRKAAERLDLKSHSYVGKVVRLTKKRLNSKSRSVQTTRLPEDKRGNEVVADG